MKAAALLSIGALTILSACSSQQSFNNFDDYRDWMSAPEHGLTAEREVNGIDYKVTFLTPEYQAYLDFRGSEEPSDAEWQEAVNAYRQHPCFVMQIGPSGKGLEHDIMFHGLSNSDEFSAQAQQLNFGLESAVWLREGDKAYFPVLSTLENVYGLSSHRKIVFTFPPEAVPDEGEDLHFVFDDPLFETGLNKFRFEAAHLTNLPALSL